MARRSSRGRSPNRPVESNDVSLAEEYQYVIEDLQRIGIIAAILIGGLVVLSFIL